MKTLRYTVSLAGLSGLAAGYLGSQYFYFSDPMSRNAPEWASRVDSAPVVWTALVLLLGAIALSLIPSREESP